MNQGGYVSGRRVMCAAIQTRYKGCYFRSRLEARWAVFFDHLGFAWEHEPQGYVLDGIPYLPDFKLTLPGGGLVFAEVKAAETDWHEGRHVRLCRALAQDTGSPVILLIGVPAYRAYHWFTPDLAGNEFKAVFFRDYEPKIEVMDAYWSQRIVVDTADGRAGLCPRRPRSPQVIRRGSRRRSESRPVRPLRARYRGPASIGPGRAAELNAPARDA